MEVENYMSSRTTIGNSKKEEDDDDDVPLPGFRFHPTDEELVSFYLRRKVEKRPISIELIKQADIYKYDPWDLPKYSSTNGGEKEWYFFCRRGRKYKNSIRPNRVTSSGFWKATGIDRPIYDSSSRECIGLKKSLVYYRGSAGKGTKTEWMMHEFRLPPKTTKHMDNSSTIDNPQEAEVWTLCRILKRNVAYRKCAPADWREVADDHHNKRSNNMIINNIPVVFDASSKTCSVESCDDRSRQSSYISFNAQAPATIAKKYDQNKLYYSSQNNIDGSIGNHHQQHDLPGHLISSSAILDVSADHHHQAPSDAASSFSSYTFEDINEFLRHADWEDLRSVVDYAAAAATNNPASYYQTS